MVPINLSVCKARRHVSITCGAHISAVWRTIVRETLQEEGTTVKKAGKRGEYLGIVRFSK